MDVSYRIKNFKAFADSNDIEFRPITVFCGANSSGKSSILKSLLLIKQSMAQRRYLDLDYTVHFPLLFNGEWANLGAYSDTVHQKDRDTDLYFQWKSSGLYADVAKLMGPRFSRGRSPSGQRIFHSLLETTFRSDPSEREEISTFIDRTSISLDKLEIAIAGSSSYEMRNGIYNVKISDLSLLLNGHFSNFARFTLYQQREIPQILLKCANSVVTGNVKIRFTGPFISEISPIIDKSWLPFMQFLDEEVRKSRTGTPGRVPTWYLEFVNQRQDFHTHIMSDFEVSTTQMPARLAKLFNLIQFILYDVQTAFTVGQMAASSLWRNLRYIGPLRHQPQRYYQFVDTGDVDIGVSGEFTVQILSLEADKPHSGRPISYDEDGQLYT